MAVGVGFVFGSAALLSVAWFWLPSIFLNSFLKLFSLDLVDERLPQNKTLATKYSFYTPISQPVLRKNLTGAIIKSNGSDFGKQTFVSRLALGL